MRSAISKGAAGRWPRWSLAAGLVLSTALAGTAGELSGTLPEWQELPLTWLGIAGLACTIIGFVVMFFTQDQGYGGLFAP